ncbi:TerY-C metal binding domain-containing protein [Caballeronia sp. LZ029]|uniref:TerY-C metal binding domain-containing protein n=1 Tax=Caballeronia sp. LZ029 TaxID=3038564 RepID=UPI002866EA9D|nr:TerY-C metal binding domain-containing protein [Caballeronia sp. LZ029]MDR5745051.1 TerY-C metal binding domain-containing protein [Caballeronia sp. LZ029]
MRRLPVFFVLDCSESMAGDKIAKMESGLQSIVRNLRTDPHALETVHVSVLAFAGVAKTIVPLVEVVSFYPPKLPLGGGTALGAALTALMDEMGRSVVRTTADRKGDWKPIVYLFTDGRPTDRFRAAISRWNADYAHRATLIAVGIGANADLSVLRELTEHVLLFDDAQVEAFSKFVKWVSSSVMAHSKSAGDGVQSDAVPILDEKILQIVKEAVPAADDACVTLVGRCQKSRAPYLVKYDRESGAVNTRAFAFDVSGYRLSGCYPIGEDYFQWSGTESAEAEVNTSMLYGSPSCPHCGNATAFAACACRKLLCVGGPGEARCPWCAKNVVFGYASSEDDGGFDVLRGQG